LGQGAVFFRFFDLFDFPPAMLSSLLRPRRDANVSV
jgi:hypothetical protein